MENMKIMTSVGVGGKNKQHDVEAVQTALNQLNSLIKPIKILVVDGKLGTRPESSKTVIAIKAFQQKVVGSIRPDGRIDLNGRTHKLINAKLCVSNPPHSNSLLFPLKQRPQFSYKQGPRAFGSNRSGGRKHAGCDLYATAGTDIRAIADGTVTAIYYFYLGTKAIEVDHGKYHVRYGEVRGEATALKVGSKVKRGETIAKVGTLKFKSGKTMSMLHIEFYNKSSFGALTVRSNLPYKRRSDLINPTSILDSATLT